MDQDLWFKAIHFHGPLLLQTILDEDSDAKDKIEKDRLNMCQFIRNRIHMLLEPCDYSSDVLPEHIIPTVPIELFQNTSRVDRRDLFFKSLDRGNILILRIINDTLPDNYKLLVLCREDNCMKLDDLSLIMYLPKLKEETDLVGELKSNDLIRAAVCSCSIDERKLYVTLDRNILDDDTEKVQLGKISETDVPFYVGDVDVGSSYVEYLHHKPEFINPTWSEELYSFLDIKKRYLYSFLYDLDGKKYNAIVCAPELRKKQMWTVSHAQYKKAVAFYDVGNFTEAFVCLNKALKLYPENIEALVCRGTLYANTNNLRKAFVDMEEAIKINPKHKGACKQMSVLLVQVARIHIESNDLEKAQESLDAALNVDSSNPDAVAAIEEIRRKVGDSEKLNKEPKLNKKNRIGSSSSESSNSKKDDLKEKHDTFLQASTKAFLSSLKRKHLNKDKKNRRHHHGPHKYKKSTSKSPNKRNLIELV